MAVVYFLTCPFRIRLPLQLPEFKKERLCLVMPTNGHVDGYSSDIRFTIGEHWNSYHCNHSIAL